MINQEWKIKARAQACSATGSLFADGEPFYAALFEDGSEDGFVRRDYSVEAWGRAREDESFRPFSHWRSVYEAPAAVPERKEVVEKEGAESLLRRLIEEDDALTEDARFILAVMLERRRLLREADSKSLGGAMLRIYEHTKTGEVFLVRDPMLKLDQIDAVQKQVAELLGGVARAPGTREPVTGPSVFPGDEADADRSNPPA